MDRRRDDRRTDFVSLAEYTVPELRKAFLTLLLLAAALALFLYMVHGVIVAVIGGVVAGAYLLPLQRWIETVTGRRSFAAIVTIVVFTVPVVAIVAYSWIEISGAAQYLSEHRDEVIAGLSHGMRNVPFADSIDLADRLPVWVAAAADSIAHIADELRETIDEVVVGISVFLFTTFFILTDHVRVRAYLRARVPGRYRSLIDPVANNIESVVYGVLYGTFLTQLIKSIVILSLNVIWHVPLAIVLAIASFFIGLLPVVGSWTIYVPVAAYLALWRGDIWGGIAMLAIGVLINTLFISMYLRPKIAAEKSQVLNFYWMFIALVTGVYTFGLMGIIIGPVLISVLKAVFDAVSGDAFDSVPEALPAG